MDKKTMRIIRYAAAAVLMLIIIFILVKCTPDDTDTSTAAQTTAQTDTTQSTDTSQTGTDTTASTDTTSDTSATNPLECDAYPAVNELVQKYFDAKASGDTTALNETVNYLGSDEESSTSKMSDHIESYQNIHCYTKKGPADNSWVVYAVYDIKFENIDTVAPSLTMLYVCTDEDGSLYIDNGTWDADAESKISAMNQDSDVQQLVAQVQSEYDAAINSDEKLKSLADSIQSATSDSSDSSEQILIYAKETVNIRSQASENATKIGSLPQGESAVLLSQDDSGWDQIEYNNQTGYVKAEYVTTNQDEATAAAEASSDSSSGQTMKVIETAKMRAGESTDSAYITTIYVDDTVTVLEQLSSGRSKISYNGQTGYVNSECLGN